MLTPRSQPSRLTPDELIASSLKPSRAHKAIVVPNGSEPLPLGGIAPENPILDQLSNRHFVNRFRGTVFRFGHLLSLLELSILCRDMPVQGQSTPGCTGTG